MSTISGNFSIVIAGIEGGAPAAHQAGELRGWIDSATHEEIYGWAWQAEHPTHPVRLEILVGDVPLGETVANENRPDVRDAGHGDGRCGFTFRLPQPLLPFVAHTIRVRRAADHAELWNSGQVTIAASTLLDAPALESFAAALHARAAMAESDAERDALTCFMVTEVNDLRTVCGRPSLSETSVGAPGAARPLALFIDEVLPAPDRDSASQVALDHMRSLQSLGYRVAFAAVNATEGDTAPLDALGVTACLPPDILTSR
jgi:hypothetical protein